MRNTPPPTVPAAVEDSSRGAPSPLWQTTPPPVCQPTPSPGPSCYSPPPSGGGERDAWNERKSRFLITKYKEAKDNIGRKGGFRELSEVLEREHHITPVALLAPGRIVANGEKPSYPTANFSATPFA
ncbi:uncharacterized protein LOC144128063 isoform X2 [Amblyomma americanum]